MRCATFAFSLCKTRRSPSAVRQSILPGLSRLCCTCFCCMAQPASTDTVSDAPASQPTRDAQRPILVLLRVGVLSGSCAAVLPLCVTPAALPAEDVREDQ